MEHHIVETSGALADSIAHFGGKGPVVDAFATMLSASQIIMKDSFPAISPKTGTLFTHTILFFNQ